MTSLVAALQATPKGSRELDARIATALGQKVKWCGSHKQILYAYDPTRWPATWRVPRWTASFDTARTLIPEEEDKPSRWIVTELCQRVRADSIGDDFIWHWYCALSYLSDRIQHFNIRPDAEASTPALALCAAALQAQQAMEK